MGVASAVPRGLCPGPSHARDGTHAQQPDVSARLWAWLFCAPFTLSGLGCTVAGPRVHGSARDGGELVSLRVFQGKLRAQDRPRRRAPPLLLTCERGACASGCGLLFSSALTRMANTVFGGELRRAPFERMSAVCERAVLQRCATIVAGRQKPPPAVHNGRQQWHSS